MKDITDMEKDRQYMKMALELAQKGMGVTAVSYTHLTLPTNREV